jgi:hypothetical protein
MKRKWRKIIDYKNAFYFSFLFVFVFFIYFIFLYYSQIKGYIKYKENKTVKAPGISLAELPVYNETSIKKTRDIFSEYREKKKVSFDRKEVIDYNILGVVKKNKLFAIVYFAKSKKIELFEQGSRIDANTVVDKIEVDKITLKKNGKKITYNVFKSQNGVR